MTPVREFHKAFDMTAPDTPPLKPDAEVVRLRMRLIREEYEEVMAELTKLTQPHVTRDPDAVMLVLSLLLKELADLRYVVEGAAVDFALDIDAAYVEVHRSNMSKLGEDGKPIHFPNGKVRKGPNYSPADMTPFVPPIIEHEEEASSTAPSL